MGSDRRRIVLERPGRLDVVLAEAWPEVSRSQLGKWIRDGRVVVEGRPVKRPSFAIRAGDAVDVEPPPTKDDTILPDETVPFRVVYEDRDVIVIDKPAGVIVHPGVLGETGTLVHGLLARFPELADGFTDADALRPGIVHRLDRGTSGIMVVARNAAARLALIEQFQARTIEKIYNAWVFGRPPSQGSWIGPIGRHPRDRKRFAVVQRGKPARTDFCVRAVAPHAAALVVQLHTGRTHQIRVHAHAAGVPLLGDPGYRKRGRIPAEFADWGPGRDRPALHAAQLSFTHPSGGERRTFSSPLPPDLEELDARFESV